MTVSPSKPDGEAPRFNRRLETALGVVGWTIILVVAATSKPSLVYDEPYYLAPVAAFQQYGLSVALIANYPEVGGLVHTGIHWLLSPVTGLSAPAIRLVNPFVVALAVAALAWLLASVPPYGGAAFASRLMALPPIWVVSGLALTEPPAFALVAIGLAMFYRSRACRSLGAGLALAAAGGVAFAGAVLAKQIALAILGGVVWLGWRRVDWRPHAVTFVVSTLVVLLPIFMLWGGLAPPIASTKQVGLFSLTHVLYAFGYATLFSLVACHGFFAGQVWRRWPYLAGVVLLNLLFGVIQMRPFASGVTRVAGAALLPLYDRLAGGVLIAAALVFGGAMIGRFRDQRDNPVWTSAAVGLCLGLASAGAVTYSFSSRYLTVVSPLLFVVLLPYRRTDLPSSLLLMAGHLAGAISLLAYLGYLSR